MEEECSYNNKVYFVDDNNLLSHFYKAIIWEFTYIFEYDLFAAELHKV